MKRVMKGGNERGSQVIENREKERDTEEKRKGKSVNEWLIWKLIQKVRHLFDQIQELNPVVENFENFLIFEFDEMR